MCSPRYPRQPKETAVLMLKISRCCGGYSFAEANSRLASCSMLLAVYPTTTASDGSLVWTSRTNPPSWHGGMYAGRPIEA